jgi:hypothetical protein
MSLIKWSKEELDELTDETSDAYKAYQKGFLQSQFAVRKNIIEMAKNGSSPAQTMAEKLIKDYNYDREAN